MKNKINLLVPIVAIAAIEYMMAYRILVFFSTIKGGKVIVQWGWDRAIPLSVLIILVFVAGYLFGKGNKIKYNGKTSSSAQSFRSNLKRSSSIKKVVN